MTTMRIDVARTHARPVAWKVVLGEKLLRLAGSKPAAIKFAVEYVQAQWLLEQRPGHVFVESDGGGFRRYLSTGFVDLVAIDRLVRASATAVANLSNRASQACAEVRQVTARAKERIEQSNAQIRASRTALEAARTALARLERTSRRRGRSLVG